MYPISNTVKALYEAEQHQVLRITGTDKNGAAISITDADIVLNSFNIDRFSCIGNKLEIGTATAAEMTLKLDNRQGDYDNIVFEGTELYVEIGIADWTQTNPTVHWMPCGYFTPDEQPRTRDIITIHALDRMMRFDVVPPVMSPWVTQGGDYVTDSQGNIIYFLTNVRFPITVENLVKRVAMLCGVPFNQSLTSFPNYNYTIASLPSLQQQVTLRNLIQWCAGIMGANAWIDWTGSLRFSWYGATTGYTSTTTNRFSSDLHEADITITGVQYTNTQGVTIVSGTDDYAIDLTGNYLAAAGIATILPNIKNARNGFTYRPFTASVINAPYLWPMDTITFNKDSTNYTCALTNVNFGINGVMAVESKGETAQTNRGAAPSGVTTEQARLIEQAFEVVNNLDKSLDQEGIFNRLTNNGEAQGIYIIDGQVYVNMSYARSGTLLLGGLNNQNGLLKVFDANGTEIGHWGYDGIVLNKGTIVGPSITVGGNNNGNGTLTVLDNNGNVIALINSSGATINSGSINLNNGVFSVSQSGALVAGNASITGSITAKDYTGVYSVDVDSGEIDWRYNGEKRSDIYTISGTNGGLLYLNTYASSQTAVLLLGNHTAQFGTSYGTTTDIIVNGDFRATGTKNRVVHTDQYSDRLLYCYETPSPMFGDVGEGTIGEDGKCYIWLDPVFAQTITTTHYQVFLQRYGSGECWVSERNGSYFVVDGTPGMAFGWEIKAKQRDYDQRRLEKADSTYSPERHNYGIDAAQYIDGLQKGRILV